MGKTKKLLEESFELMSEEEFEDSIRAKYGYTLIGTMKLATGDTCQDNGEEYLRGIEQPNLQDLDNLFCCCNEEDDALIIGYYNEISDEDVLNALL